MPSNPINVFPNGNTVDVTDSPIFNFTFTGSELSSYWYYICTAGYTGVLVSGTETLTASVYNGEEVSFTVPTGTLANGVTANYTWGMVFDPLDNTEKWAYTQDWIWQGGRTIKNPKATYDYFFYARSNPTVTPTIENSELFSGIYKVYQRELNIACVYAQSEGIQVKYFSFDLYQGDDETDIKPINLLDSTGKVFSSNIKYSYDGLLDGENYIVVFNLDTQSDQTVNQIFYITADYTPVTLDELNLQLNYNDNINAFELTWNKGAFSSPIERGEITYPTGSSFVKIGDTDNEYGMLSYTKVSGKDIELPDQDNFGFSSKFRINPYTKDILSVNLITEEGGGISFTPVSVYFTGTSVDVEYEHNIVTSFPVNNEWALQPYSGALSDTVYMWYEDNNHSWSNTAAMWYLQNDTDFQADFITIINFINGTCSASIYQLLSDPSILGITGSVMTVGASYGVTGYTVYYYTGGQWNELGEGTV